MGWGKEEKCPWSASTKVLKKKKKKKCREKCLKS